MNFFPFLTSKSNFNHWYKSEIYKSRYSQERNQSLIKLNRGNLSNRDYGCGRRGHKQRSIHSSVVERQPIELNLSRVRIPLDAKITSFALSFHPHEALRDVRVSICGRRGHKQRSIHSSVVERQRIKLSLSRVRIPLDAKTTSFALSFHPFSNPWQIDGIIGKK